MYGPRMYYGPVDPDSKRCHFCAERLLTSPNDPGEYTEEVGEFWSSILRASVLAHPDCLPMGVDATLAGEDPEWSLA